MKLILKRILFYVVSFTWGGLMSLIGLIAMIVTLPFGKFGIYHGRLYKRIGKNWGGVELGCFFFCDETAGKHTLKHECGHGLQNCLWGPLMPFVICIPSAARYWYREYIYRTDREKYKQLPKYDDIWFEGQATKWGEQYVAADKI